MHHSELAIAGFYDHEQDERHRAPDWGGDDLFAAGPTRRRRFERSPYPTRLRETTEHPLPAPKPEPVAYTSEPLTSPPTRRTVTITGHPGATAVTPRRPSRTIDDRIAHRPERIASWTCSLGLLSIVLAIVTAQ